MPLTLDDFEVVHGLIYKKCHDGDLVQANGGLSLAYAELAVQAEREACAQRLDDEADALLDGQNVKFASYMREMAAAIRARRSQ